jgi:hypothetical protein
MSEPFIDSFITFNFVLSADTTSPESALECFQATGDRRIFAIFERKNGSGLKMDPPVVVITVGFGIKMARIRLDSANSAIIWTCGACLQERVLPKISYHPLGYLRR